MIELINLLLELFKGICELLYCPEWLVNEATIYVGLVVTLLLLGSFLYKKAILPFFLWRNQKLLNKDLHPYYSPFDVERTTRYYVPVKYQNLAPSEDQNPGSKYIATAKEPLIPLFVNKAFKNSADDNKYYMILADSGMGKTTFMINLYLAYKNKCRFFWQAPKYEIKLFPLAAPNILEIIEKVPNQENTILLLDAFDEDLEALKDHKKRLNEILDKVHRFREIVITCRTQFFPTEEEEPHKTGYRSYGEQGEYKFQKLYLSVFDDKAVKLYLKKRFSIFQRQKRKKAFEIAQKSPSLIMRPMLLSYIEDLVDTDKTFEFSFQIYEVLIDKWLEREANKPKMTEKYGSEAACKKALLEFSEKLAVDLYENKQKYGGYSLPRGKDFCTETISILDIEKEHEDKINKAISAEKTAKSKSLLNRNAKGDYKFSHKSILEYL